MQWFQIPRRATQCHQCRTPFLPGSEYYSCLGEERTDFCPECFKNPGTIFWKGAVPLKREPHTNRTEEALELLRECREEMAYILALYLVRQKALIKRQEVDDCILYEVCATEEILSIKQVDIAKIDVAEVQKEIADRLNGAKVR